jgi:hypothetical protein
MGHLIESKNSGVLGPAGERAHEKTHFINGHIPHINKACIISNIKWEGEREIHHVQLVFFPNGLIPVVASVEMQLFNYLWWVHRKIRLLILQVVWTPIMVDRNLSPQNKAQVIACGFQINWILDQNLRFWIE